MSDDPIDTFYAISTGRKTYFQANIDDYERWQENGEVVHIKPRDEELATKANLISSEMEPDRHMPVIDCDYPITAIPSSTPGHFHLYIDQELTWEQYKALLDGFLAAGLIQKMWYDSAVKDKRSYVRLPHVHKLPKQVEAEVADPVIIQTSYGRALPAPVSVPFVPKKKRSLVSFFTA